jgi:cysteinyl-tRNA synthetase
VLVRVLRFAGYDVTYVRNVTDVDDKILNRAKTTGKPFLQVAEENLASFRADMVALNTLPPTHEPRATQHIDNMVAMVSQLMADGLAYGTKDGSVYFRTKRFKHYGCLSKKPLNDLRAGARVEAAVGKEDPLDFALWKGVEAPEPMTPDYEATTWAGPCKTKGFLGFNKQALRGRPGWHIECSAMIKAILGQRIDIHAGGADLVFPHHENELAQSVGCCGPSAGKQDFVNTWMHNGFVNVSGEKMSKSLGNFTTIAGLLANYDANTIRCFLLTNHYRMPVDFNDEALQSAKTNMGKLTRTLGDTLTRLSLSPEQADALAYPTAQGAIADNPAIQPLIDGLTFDVNTAQALAFINEKRHTLNTLLAQPTDTGNTLEITQTLTLLVTALSVLGFVLTPLLTTQQAMPTTIAEAVLSLYIALSTELGTDSPIVTDPLEALALLVALRSKAKAEKNWPLADKIRTALTDCGVKLLDKKTGDTTWEWGA